MKRIWMVTIFFFLLACSCSFPAYLVQDVPALSTPSVTCRPPEGIPAESGTVYTVIQLHKSGGSLHVQLQTQAPIAAALGQDMFVEFNASW